MFKHGRQIKVAQNLARAIVKQSHEFIFCSIRIVIFPVLTSPNQPILAHKQLEVCGEIFFFIKFNETLPSLQNRG